MLRKNKTPICCNAFAILCGFRARLARRKLVARAECARRSATSNCPSTTSLSGSVQGAAFNILLLKHPQDNYSRESGNGVASCIISPAGHENITTTRGQGNVERGRLCTESFLQEMYTSDRLSTDVLNYKTVQDQESGKRSAENAGTAECGGGQAEDQAETESRTALMARSAHHDGAFSQAKPHLQIIQGR